MNKNRENSNLLYNSFNFNNANDTDKDFNEISDEIKYNQL